MHSWCWSSVYYWRVRRASGCPLSHTVISVRSSSSSRLCFSAPDLLYCSSAPYQWPPRSSAHTAYVTRVVTGLLLIYRPRKDERLSWPSWLTCSGRFTHIVVTRRLQAERIGQGHGREREEAQWVKGKLHSFQKSAPAGGSILV